MRQDSDSNEMHVAQSSSLQGKALRLGPHSRGYLPHWKAEGAAYFVTLRLAGSLPEHVLERIHNESRQKEQDPIRPFRQIPPDEKRKLTDTSEKVEEYLDMGAGGCFLGQKQIADMVGNALRHFDAARYRLHAYVIMPNHLHVLVTPLAENSLSSILHSWKSFTANQANKLLGREGAEFWQRESYDHLVRDENDFLKACEYIQCNPVKAGLVPEPQEWPYLGLRRNNTKSDKSAGRMPALQRRRNTARKKPALYRSHSNAAGKTPAVQRACSTGFHAREKTFASARQ